MGKKEPTRSTGRIRSCDAPTLRSPLSTGVFLPNSIAPFSRAQAGPCLSHGTAQPPSPYYSVASNRLIHRFFGLGCPVAIPRIFSLIEREDNCVGGNFLCREPSPTAAPWAISWRCRGRTCQKGDGWSVSARTLEFSSTEHEGK